MFSYEPSMLQTTILRESKVLRNQTQLLYFFAHNNFITTIDEDAFDDLLALQTLALGNNRIQELTVRTMTPLRNITDVGFDNNLLTTIDENIFSQNINLFGLHLQYNQIDKVHPRAFANLTDLSYLNLSGNKCVDRSFLLNQNPENIEWKVLNNLLKPCVKNFFRTR